MLRTYVYRLHGINYKDSLFIQERLQNKLVSGETCIQYLLYADYSDHIFTQGKHGKKNNLLVDRQRLGKLDIKYFETDRGGDITYHGPGQIVIYPVFNLRLMKLGVKKYVNRIESMLSAFLKEFGLFARTIQSRPGLWVGDKKIASVGINVKRHITKHGFALNINNDLSYFDYINPCGFNNLGITSLENEIEEKTNIDSCLERLFLLIEQFFNVELVEKSSREILDTLLKRCQ